MQLTFWQPIPSFHQQGLFAALVKADWVESVTLKVEQLLPAGRRASGWRELQVEGMRIEAMRRDDRPAQSSAQVHVFTGFGTHAKIWKAFDRIPAGAPCQRYAYSEAPELVGIKGILRRMKYRIVAYSLAPRLHGIFAIGDLGVQFFGRVAPPSTSVHGFAYFDVEQFRVPDFAEPDGDGSFQILYAGQLIPRKRVEALLQALSALQDADWELTVIGAGPQRERLQRRAARFERPARIRWIDPVPHNELERYYRRADCVVLPSRWDGWGMIVNEALRQGCEVLATESSGASCLLPPENRLTEDLDQWRSHLRQLIHRGKLTSEQRRQNARLAEAHTGVRGAELLQRIFRETRTRRS